MARLALLALLAASAFAQSWGPPPGANPTYSLLYTGRLFGYFRYPDVQATTDSGCPEPAARPLPPQVKLFRSTVERLHSEHQPLVAMGGNFAPELLARTELNKTPGTPHFGEMISKDIFAANAHPIASDNVACFLRLMGFDAVVPGQEDFYYGPERLREIGLFLDQPGAAPYRPVKMLAANLAISSVVRNAAPRLPSAGLPAEIRQALDGPAPFRFDLPSFVLPWLTEVHIRGSAPALTVYDCAAKAGDPRNFELPGKSGACTQLATEGATVTIAGKSLDPASNHALCGVYGEAHEIHCQLFSVQTPLLPSPYVVPPDRQSPVIFGVLDPDLVGYIGQLSDVWRNQNERFDTTVQIGDPIETLRQALGACSADGNCKDRRKILLAQMPYYRASQLAANLKVFDIVIAQPDEEHATGEETNSRSAAPGGSFLLTPGQAFDAHRTELLTMNLRRADFYAKGDKQRFLANAVYDEPLKAPTQQECRTCALDTAVAGAIAQPEASIESSYEKLALKSMQQFCNADIALLQHRDVFSAFANAVAYWPPDVPATPQQLLDEVLWKGDFAFCLPLKGSTIKRMLAESDAFDKQDRDNLSLATEKGRGLSTLGIQTDPRTSTPAIRGQAIEDNKLYGVAMTDYLAFGNTGYPELSSEAIQPVVRIVSLQDLNRLTGLACRALPENFTNGSCQGDPIAASDYFAAIRQRPFDTTHGVTAWLEFRRWFGHPLEPQPIAATLLAKPSREPEKEVERRPYWWFTLQNVSLGYNLNFIRGSDKTVPGNFAGNNSFSQLSTPESSAVSLWARARGGYAFSRYIDFYMSGEIKYSQLAVRSSTGDGNFGEYQLTLGNNLLRGEAGITSKPLTPRVPVRLLVSEDLFTQAVTPFQQFTAPLACGDVPCSNGATSLTSFDLPKNFLVVTRLGARIQNSQSWFEAGREYGANIGLVRSYSLNDLASPLPRPCDITQGISLSDCIANDPLFTNQSKIVPHTQSQGVAGWFANFHVVMPVWRSNLQLVADSYGEVFDRMPGDTRYNTRFYEDFTVALKVPLWGNLSFAPQVETFYFQNKILPEAVPTEHHYVFVTTAVTLQYGFDWHRGVGLLRALRFPNGVSTTTSGTMPRP